jgi:hypothetical protein
MEDADQLVHIVVEECLPLMIMRVFLVFVVVVEDAEL